MCIWNTKNDSLSRILTNNHTMCLCAMQMALAISKLMSSFIHTAQVQMGMSVDLNFEL